jgi:hypothetical protein
MTGIELAILVCGIAAIVFLSTALCWMANKLEALDADVSGLRDIVEKLVTQRVDETLTAGCRSLNEVGRS